MTILQNFRKSISNFIDPEKNSMNINVPSRFRRFGNRGVMTPDWTEVEMSDIDHYSGYGYAIIKNRANKVAKIAKENVRTESKDHKDHKYLELIRNSTLFSETKFWHDISTYLDLEGVYYLLAVRTIERNGEAVRVGEVQYFKLLNPYEIRRVINTRTMEVTGYVETRGGMVRELPPEMVIEFRELNPFDSERPFAMTDAFKGSQFTLKTSGDYTRHALRNNINAPGILSTDVQLEEEEFKNFINRIRKHKKGEPIFGNGEGKVTYNNMQIELTKAALKDVNEVNRSELFAVGGVSKTILGIEESGTTRETARVQKELNIEDQILPRIQLVLDELNLDYQKTQGKKFEANNALLVVDNPMANDIDADIKEVDLKDKQLDLYQKLINKGVDKKLASEYVKGEIGIEMLDIKESEIIGIMEDKKEEKEENTFKNDYRNNLIGMQEASLRSAIVNIDEKLAGYAISRVGELVKNDFSLADLLSWNQRDEAINELRGVLSAFYGVMFVLQGQDRTRDRVSEFDLSAEFKLDIEAKEYIKDLSNKVARSHIKTVSDDLYKTAFESALAGKSREGVISDLKNKYFGTISETRAKTIARTETNRAFTRAQYEADRMFIKENKLKAYKQWRTRSDNPCPICLELQAMGKIPFNKNFVKKGDKLTAGDVTMKFDFENVVSGNAHPNCSCDYELIVEL